MESSFCACIGNMNGSDTIKAPFGMVKLGLPLNVNVFNVFVTMALLPGVLLKGSATVTAVIGSAVAPNALLMRKRCQEPEVVTWIVWRKVELPKTSPVVLNGGGGKLAGSVN